MPSHISTITNSLNSVDDYFQLNIYQIMSSKQQKMHFIAQNETFVLRFQQNLFIQTANDMFGIDKKELA